MNNKIIKLIIIAIILIIIIIGILLILLNKNNNYIEETPEGNFQITLEEKVYLLNENQTFYTIETIIQKYINTIKDKETEQLMNILSKEYIQENQITNENILQKLITVKEEENHILEMVYAQDEWEYSIYYTYGTINNVEIYNKIIFDFTTVGYSIQPITKKQYEDAINNNIQEKNVNIQLNNYNMINYVIVKDETIVGKYFTKYRELCKNDIQKAYELLDEEYRNKRFGNVNNFKKYVNDIKDEIESIYGTSYKKNKNKDYTEYICTDRYGNIYTFKETSPMQFTMLLDTYTIEQAKFTKEYSKANDQKKVMLNIDKFIQMVNSKDYTAAYNCLADSFKNNYFKTELSFEKYIKTNLYRYNTVIYKTYTDEVAGIHQYKLTITDKQNANNSKDFNVVMKLNSGTNFEMSFEV